MSGHSKWSSIKRQKAVIDAKRGARFTQLARAITVAVREAGGDITVNFKLRLAVDKARQANMPKDNIERAIKRGTGELKGDITERVTYEAFAPGGSALIIEALTDNRNRTVSDIKTILGKFGGTLSGVNSVRWMFVGRGVIHVVKPTGEMDELQLIDFGVDDVIDDGDELVLLTSPETLAEVREKLESSNWIIKSAEFDFWPKNPAKFPKGKEGEKFMALVEALEDNDDIEHVATSAVG